MKRPLGLLVLIFTVAGCSGQVLPLGPAPALTPAPRQLASAIVLQPGLVQTGVSANQCPARSVRLSGPGTPTMSAGNGGSAGTSSGLCFRELGQPVRFTSAGVSVFEQPGGNEPVKHSALWGVRVDLRGAEAAALTTVSSRVAGTKDQMAIIIAGQVWGLPVTPRPITGGQIIIPAQSKNQAMQLQRTLLRRA